MAYTCLVRFDWDEEKNISNQANHGLSFEEAQELFQSDTDYLEIFDEVHSDHEDRFIAIGPINRGVIMVVFTERDEDTTRIISARPATKREQQMFHRYSGGKP
jgi:uncharacterized DUF497 family protein